MNFLIPITPNIVVNTLGIERSGNFGAIRLNDCIVVIDSGASPKIGTKFRKELKSKFKQEIKYVILTHTHTDHRNGLASFSDIPIIMSSKSLNNMPTTFKRKNFNIITFENRYTIGKEEEKIEIFHGGGHTIGSSYIYFPKEKALFSGDLLFLGNVNYNIPFFGFYQNKPKRTGNPEEAIKALEHIIDLNVDILIPGHGKHTFNPQYELAQQLSFLKTLRSSIKKKLQDSKNLDSLKLSDFDLIRQAYDQIESEPKTKKHKDHIWLENYLNWLKKSFYNYYNQEN